MVTKREFNKIKKENPESRIGKRTWEEQKFRNELAKVLIKAMKKGVSHPYIELYQKKLKSIMQKNKLIQSMKKRYNITEEIVSHFENINLLSGISEEKLSELQKSDLVLIYRDNDSYKDMSSALKDLLETECCLKIYCISIPKGTESIDDEKTMILKEILSTCHCITDYTVDGWTRDKSISVQDQLKHEREVEYLDNMEERCSDIQTFIKTIKELEKSFLDKKIDTVYIFTSGYLNDGRLYSNLFDHGHLCQREDGGIYFAHPDFSALSEEDKMKYIEEAKNFWETMFNNLNVEFIEGYNVDNIPKCKCEGSVLIADRHANTKWFGGKVITFAGADFESHGGVYDFVDEKNNKDNGGYYLNKKSYGNKGLSLAKSVLLNLGVNESE